MTLCCLVNIYETFGRAYRLHVKGSFYQNAQSTYQSTEIFTYKYYSQKSYLIDQIAVTIFRMGLSCNEGRAIAQAVSRRLPTEAAQIQTRVWSCGIL
jgi:hypothetical protein